MESSVFQAVLAVECQMKESIYGYNGNKKAPFLRITMALPKLIAPAKRILETGFRFGEFPERGYSSYESNIDYEVCNKITKPLMSFRKKNNGNYPIYIFTNFPFVMGEKNFIANNSHFVILC